MVSLLSHYNECARIAFGGAEDDPLIHPADEEAADEDTEEEIVEEADRVSIKSELPGVPNDKWTEFLRGMIIAEVSAVSPSNSLGMFEITPRRLADFGLVQKLARSKSKAGRTIWVAFFVPPLTCRRFLRSPEVQYKVFTKSMQDFDNKMRRGEIRRDKEMSRAGALAILHRAGPQGLDTWSTGERFPSTQNLYDKVQGAF